jgi:hypothetical protein
MIDHDAQGKIVLWFYLVEAIAPGYVLFLLRPTVAFRKFCRDCALNPMQAGCVLRLCYRRAGRAPRRQRGGHGASAGSRDDGGGGGDDGGDGGPPARSWLRGGASS